MSDEPSTAAKFGMLARFFADLGSLVDRGKNHGELRAAWRHAVGEDMRAPKIIIAFFDGPCFTIRKSDGTWEIRRYKVDVPSMLERKLDEARSKGATIVDDFFEKFFGGGR